ncbi:hypothetical protein BpHYR1_008633 [Brachionus plicatilis]|uniref:Uncharacterized protein n=1 Tax=Brachionus plicatilis TaxID=10195 RepID=A0A3M7RYH0_BRAPC|nr:hypothetical protein BpHYR1_008633 [Brachionus plicatilis]
MSHVLKIFFVYVFQKKTLKKSKQAEIILQTSAEDETTVVSLCFIYRTKVLYEISQWPIYHRWDPTVSHLRKSSLLACCKNFFFAFCLLSFRNSICSDLVNLFLTLENIDSSISKILHTLPNFLLAILTQNHFILIFLKSYSLNWRINFFKMSAFLFKLEFFSKKLYFYCCIKSKNHQSCVSCSEAAISNEEIQLCFLKIENIQAVLNLFEFYLLDRNSEFWNFKNENLDQFYIDDQDK